VSRPWSPRCGTSAADGWSLTGLPPKAPATQLPNPASRAWNETNPGLLGTRRTSAAIDAFAGNMGVVREESGPTDTGCARGPLPTGDLGQGAVVYAQVPASRLCGAAGGLASLRQSLKPPPN
jgi:hypothetical protein